MGEAGRHRGKRASRGGSFFEPMVLTDATTEAEDPRQAAPNVRLDRDGSLRRMKLFQ